MRPELSPQELRDSGLLMEVNRRFFHPLGLALTVNLPTGNEDFKPYIFIQDDREDPEGWWFGDLDNPEDKAKAANVARIEAERRPHREAVLGFWIEPLPGES